MNVRVGAPRLMSLAAQRRPSSAPLAAVRLVQASSRRPAPQSNVLRRRTFVSSLQRRQQPPETAAAADASSRLSNIKNAKTRAGTGNMDGLDGGKDSGVAMSMIPRGPVSWASLGLVAVAAASAVAYYQIERERRLENAMGKIVSYSLSGGASTSRVRMSRTKLDSHSFAYFCFLTYLYYYHDCFFPSRRYRVSLAGVLIQSFSLSANTKKLNGAGFL